MAMQWLNVECIGLWVERSTFETQPGQCVMFWTKNLPLTVPLPTQEYKWVLTNCQGSLMKCWGLTLAMDQLPIQGEKSDTPDWLMLWKP